MNISKINHSKKEYGCGLGKAKINLFNGNLGFEYPLISYGLNNFLIESSLIYNSQYKKTDFNGKKIGFSNGWKLNINQYVFKYLESYKIDGFEEGNYVFIDINWNVHRFIKYKSCNLNGNLNDVYYDSDGTGLKLFVKDDETSQIIDQFNNMYLFDNDGKMIEMISGINTNISKVLTYSGDNLISIRDKRESNRELFFMYNSDGTLKKVYTSENKIGLCFEYSESKLIKIVKYCSSEAKDVMEFMYDSVNRIEYAVSCLDLTALRFIYTTFNEESCVEEIHFGTMKKTLITEESNAEVYTGDNVFLGEEHYIVENNKKYSGFSLSMPAKYVKEKLNITYNGSYTHIRNDKGIGINYYFNTNGTTISNLEYRDGNLFTLSRSKGWTLSGDGKSNLKLDGKKVNILDASNNYTYNVNNELLEKFKNIFRDLNNDNVKDEEFSEHFNISFWMNLENNNKSSLKTTLKYYVGGCEKTSVVRFEKTDIGSWQKIIIPLNLGLNQLSLSSVKLIFDGCAIDTQIQIADLRIMKGGLPETYIFSGTGENYKELKLKMGTEICYYINDQIYFETISPEFYMTENDLFLTYKNLFYSKEKQETCYDLVSNNGAIVKSVDFAGIKNNNEEFLFCLDEHDIPNYYVKLIDIIENGKYSIMEKQVCFHYDKSILKYYFETKTMIGITDNVNSISKRLSDDSSNITYSWINEDGTFRAYKDTEKVITEIFYDLYGNYESIEVFKEGEKENEVLKTEYFYEEKSIILRDRISAYSKNGIVTNYFYNEDNLLDYIIQGDQKISYKYDKYNENITSIKNDIENDLNNSKTTEIIYSKNSNLKYFNDKNNMIYGYEYNIFNDLTKIYKNKKAYMSFETENDENHLLETAVIFQNNDYIISSVLYDNYNRLIMMKYDDIDTSLCYEIDDNKSPILNRIVKIEDGFSNEEYIIQYDDNSNIESETIEIKNKITNKIFANDKSECVIKNSEKIEFQLNKNNPLSEKIASSIYMHKENDSSENKIIEDASYTYEYDSCGRLAKKNGMMTVYDICQQCEADGGVACGECTGVKVDKHISYHKGTVFPKRFTYNVLSKEIHSGGDNCSFYYENSKYENGNIVNLVEGGMRYNENPKNSNLREKSSLQERNYVFKYDSFKRLKQEINPEFGNLTYIYNKNTGMLEEVKNNDNLIKKFTYDNVGFLTKASINGTIREIKYDSFGNMLNNYKGTLKYNSRNLMESYEFYDKTESPYYTHSYRGKYFYNHQGVRYKKRWIEEITGMSPQVKNIEYYLKGDIILGEDWTDDSGNITTKLRYFYDIEGICGIKYDGHTFTLVRDSLGNVSKVMYKGKIIGEYLYDAWGNCVVKEIAVSNDRDRFVLKYNPFRYKGYYCDLESGLYYCKSRYYDSNLCTWLSPDNIDYLDPESVNGLNLYIYCNYNPINYYDPSGNSAIVIGLIIGAIIGASIGFGTAAYIDYQDDGQVFNGSVAWYDYLGATVVGGVLGAGIGAGIGYLAPYVGSILTTPIKFSIPTGFQMVQTSLGTNMLVSTGAMTLSFTGAQALELAGLISGVTIMFTQTIVDEGGVKITHNYPNDHGSPVHVHVSSDKGVTRVGPNGYPLNGDRPLNELERRIFWKNIQKIRKAIKKLQKIIRGKPW